MEDRYAWRAQVETVYDPLGYTLHISRMLDDNKTVQYVTGAAHHGSLTYDTRDIDVGPAGIAGIRFPPEMFETVAKAFVGILPGGSADLREALRIERGRVDRFIEMMGPVYVPGIESTLLPQHDPITLSNEREGEVTP